MGQGVVEIGSGEVEGAMTALGFHGSITTTIKYGSDHIYPHNQLHLQSTSTSLSPTTHQRRDHGMIPKILLIMTYDQIACIPLKGSRVLHTMHHITCTASDTRRLTSPERHCPNLFTREPIMMKRNDMPLPLSSSIPDNNNQSYLATQDTCR